MHQPVRAPRLRMGLNKRICQMTADDPTTLTASTKASEWMLLKLAVISKSESNVRTMSCFDTAVAVSSWAKPRDTGPGRCQSMAGALRKGPVAHSRYTGRLDHPVLGKNQ